MTDAKVRVATDTHADVTPAELNLRRLVDKPARSHMRFVHKVALLITALICITGISITLVTTYRFRDEMYQAESRSAFTVYTAVANYLSGHYKSNQNRYIIKSIDFVLRNKFLRLEGEKREMITHLPSRLILYDAHGKVLYEYDGNDLELKARDLHPGLLPLSYGPYYYPEEKTIRVAGSVSPSGDVPGYIEAAFPTTVQSKVRALFLQSFRVMAIVIFIAVVLSWVFSRHVLAPIEALTSAAKRVHRGDLEQQVTVSTDDEIGVLAATFNGMVASISKRIALLHKIQEWTVKIGKELESERLYGTLVAMFSLMSTSHACRLYIYDKNSDSLDCRLDRGAPHLPPPDADELSHRAFEERWTLYQTEAGQITDDAADAHQLAIPLLSGDHRIGVIRIGENRERIVYDDETLTILHTLAQHASVATDNAHLYGELAEKERIEQEMKWARRIQQSMLPRDLPVIPGYELAAASNPAFEVGGDYYDCLTVNGTCYFVIADVSGKGVPAALVMSIVRSLLHTYVDLSLSPVEVLSRVNARLSVDLEPDMFVTITVASLDTSRHVLQVARGGHEPTLLQRAEGELIRIRPSGAGVGILELEEFEESLEPFEAHIEEGDTLLFYTDGVTEAMSVNGEEFGTERVERILHDNAERGAKAIFETITEDIAAFSSGRSQHDDITLIAIRRNSNGGQEG